MAKKSRFRVRPLSDHPFERGKNPFQEAFRQGMQITMDQDFYEPVDKDKLDNTFKDQITNTFKDQLNERE